MGYSVHWTPLSLSETDSPVGGWYHALSSKPPLHCGSRWSGRSWTPSSPPYLCSTIKSNWWLIISELVRSQNTLPQSHVPDCPLSICKMQRPPMVRFFCDSPDSPGSTAHQVNPLCWKLLRRTDASWVLTGGLSSVDNQNRLFGGADSACSGAFAYTRKVSKGKRHQESLIIMDGEPDYF